MSLETFIFDVMFVLMADTGAGSAKRKRKDLTEEQKQLEGTFIERRRKPGPFAACHPFSDQSQSGNNIDFQKINKKYPTFVSISKSQEEKSGTAPSI